MSNELAKSDYTKIQAYYNEACNAYGVSCKVVSKRKHRFLDESEQYLVFSIHDIPDNLNVQEIYIRNARSKSLFYTDYFVIKLDEDASTLCLADAAVSYCKTVEFLNKLFKEHHTQLPVVIRGDEIGGLKEYNIGRKNSFLTPEVRAKFDKGIKKFFKQENTRSKYLQKWRAFSRTDKFDRNASTFKMFADFYKRNNQVIDLSLLHETTDDINTTVINEHEYIKFKEEIKTMYPNVLYAVSEIEVQNEGLDIKKNRNKPIHKIETGAFGKLVTYQAYCEEVEKRFAIEGYDAINDLNPAYYETRQLSYKEIDEPYVASILNSIRFAYAKSDSLETVRNRDIDIVSFVDVPIRDMMNFVSLAKSNDVPFYLDFFGKFSESNFETIRVIYNPVHDSMMCEIVKRMVIEKLQMSHISTDTNQNKQTLDVKINDAQHLQLSNSYEANVKHKVNHIEL